MSEKMYAVAGAVLGATVALALAPAAVPVAVGAGAGAAALTVGHRLLSRDGVRGELGDSLQALTKSVAADMGLAVTFTRHPEKSARPLLAMTKVQERQEGDIRGFLATCVGDDVPLALVVLHHIASPVEQPNTRYIMQRIGDQRVCLSVDLTYYISSVHDDPENRQALQTFLTEVTQSCKKL